MKVSAVIFRIRFWIHATIFVLGFNAPWNYWLHLRLDADGSTWLLLSTWLTRNGWTSFTGGTVAVLVFGTLCALLSAFLRSWAAAYLGVATVHSSSMHGDAVMAAGPYRYLRNPLYLGIIIHSLALALLMPPSGAIFTIIAIIAFELILISGEELFLTAKLGEAYIAYKARVPRLLPALRPKVPQSDEQPDWRLGFIGEIYFWGVVIAFLALGWKYNAFLITKGVIVSAGVSLIARGLMPRRK